jgi:hypothetical protein
MKRAHDPSTGRFEGTETYCNVCSGGWSARHYQLLSNEFDALNDRRQLGKKIPLNDSQTSWIMINYLDKGGLTILCKQHLKKFSSFGDGVYQRLVETSKKPVDYEPPLFDQPDPLLVGMQHAKLSKYHPVTNPSATPPKNSISTKTTAETVLAMQLFFNENTHPLPDKAPIRIFFTDIPSYRALYKHYKCAHPKESKHYLARSTWDAIRKKKFGWVKV